MQDVEPDNQPLKPDLASEGRHLQIVIMDPAGLDRDHLVDTKVEVNGVCASNYNQNHQLVGVWLAAPTSRQINVEEPPLADPFSAPVHPISSLMTIQAEEDLQQRAREHNQTAAGRQSLRQRVVVEHRIARLVPLGIRQSRYFGRTKTCLQVVMAAVVANVSLVAGYCKRQAKPAANPSAESATAARTGPPGAVFVVWRRLFTRPEPAWA